MLTRGSRGDGLGTAGFGKRGARQPGNRAGRPRRKERGWYDES